MNREDIIRMAHESHLDVYGLSKDYAKFADALERFAAIVASAERKACAMAADKHMEECEGKNFGVGRAIRAVGDKHD